MKSHEMINPMGGILAHNGYGRGIVRYCLVLELLHLICLLITLSNRPIAVGEMPGKLKDFCNILSALFWRCLTFDQ